MIRNPIIIFLTFSLIFITCNYRKQKRLEKVIESNAEDTSIKFASPFITYDNDMPIEAEFAAGELRRDEYINAKVYQCINCKSEIGKTMYLKFIVDKNGSIHGVKCLDSSGIKRKCMTDIIRIVESMPNWRPALEFDTLSQCYHKVNSSKTISVRIVNAP